MDVGLVCDACSALTPIGVPQCARCGAAVALDPRNKRASKPAPINGTNNCPRCSIVVRAGQKFCPNCGEKMPGAAGLADPAPVTFDVETRVGPRAQGPQAKPGRNTLFFGGALQAARAKLTLIRGDGEDGVSFTLAGTDHLAGRGECPISFPDDPFLSPTHANFRYFNNQLIVRDEGSLNGIFVRISAPMTIPSGTTILVGEQVLTVSAARVAEDVPDAEGTYFSASMIRPSRFKIVQHLRGGVTGWVFTPDGETVTIGREGNDINFPDDPFISGRHSALQLAAGVLSVSDMGSRNGTFVRVAGEHTLKHGDYVFMGQQLLRVEIV